MKLQNYVVGGGLKRPNGDEAQVGDTVRLYLDTVANPDFPETILGEIDHPITKVNCGSDRAYVIEYTEDFTIRVCDIIDSEVLDCCALLEERVQALEVDNSKTHVVIIGNSISVGQGTTEQSWPGQLSQLSFFKGATFHNLAVNGRSIATMDSTYEDEVAPFHPNGDDILETYVFLFSDASNNYAAGSSDPLSANQIITHRNSILQKAKDGGCITVHSTTLLRTDNVIVGTDEATRQTINADSRTNTLADYRIDLDALLPNPDDTVLYATGGIHPNNIADTIIAQLVNGVMSSSGTFALPQGPRLSGGNTWREEQRFIAGLTGPDDHAAVYDTKGDVSARIVAFALNGVTNQVFFQANAAGGRYLALYDVLAGAFVWRSIGGNLEIPKCIKPDLGPFADDAAAAAVGIPIGGQYNKTGGTVAWRVS